MDVDLIFKIAAVGILVAILNTVLQKVGKEEIGHMVTLVGVIIVLVWVIRLVKDLFDTVRTLFEL